jgi:hypothetical protein
MLPFSKLPDPDEAWRLPREIVDLIYAEIFAPLTETDDPRNYHYILQQRLKHLGQRLGYSARLEYPTPWLDQHRIGLVDVVWTAPAGGRSVAIEIDRTWKQRSIQKLIHMSQTHQPVWIFIGHRAVPFVPEGHELRKFHLIRADPSRLPKYKRRRFKMTEPRANAWSYRPFKRSEPRRVKN